MMCHALMKAETMKVLSQKVQTMQYQLNGTIMRLRLLKMKLYFRIVLRMTKSFLDRRLRFHRTHGR